MILVVTKNVMYLKWKNRNVFEMEKQKTWNVFGMEKQKNRNVFRMEKQKNAPNIDEMTAM